MTRPKLHVLSLLREAEGPGLLSMRGLCLTLTLSVASLGLPMAHAQAPGAFPNVSMEEAWQTSYQTGYQDRTNCFQPTILHGCPQPVPWPSDPATAAKYKQQYDQCVERYNAGFQAGGQDLQYQRMLNDAENFGREDAAGCVRILKSTRYKQLSNYPPGCRDELESRYKAGYGLPEAGCKDRWQDPEARPNPQPAPDPPGALPGTEAAPTAPGTSASIEPPTPEVETSEKATRGGGGGSSDLLLLVAGGAAAAVGAVALGSYMAKNSTPSSGGGSDCSSFGARNCTGGVPTGFYGSDNLCHCCVPICGGGSACHCMACGSGCGGAQEMCIGGTCVFRVGGSP